MKIEYINKQTNGRILEGGITNEGKYILSYYIITKGLQEFIDQITKM